MRILIVGMSESVHIARWISQISDQGWDVHVFPSTQSGITHRAVKNVNIYHPFYPDQGVLSKDVKIHGFPVKYNQISTILNKIEEKYYPEFRANQLARLISRIKPDIIHSIEIQHAGYLTMRAKNILRAKFPPWIVTNWGSDIYFFSRLTEHNTKIKEVLHFCDFYSCECNRDVILAREMGFEGDILPVFPNTGGFDLEETRRLRTEPASKRRVIMLKGYQHWTGRALFGLRALERCADQLSGYSIVIYSATEDVRLASILFEEATGISVKILSHDSSHEDIISMHGKARISLGLSKSDAISTSLLEAIVMGSFPIQSFTACANEWIEEGVNGLIVPPEDVEIIELAIRKALSDDHLIDSASKINYDIGQQRLDNKFLKKKTIEFYKYVYEKKSEGVK